MLGAADRSAVRRCVLCVAVCVAVSGLMAMGAGAQETGPALTLSETIRRALENNPRQISQRLGVQKAQEEQSAARGARLPSVDFNASVTRYGFPTFVTSFREIGKFPPFDETIYDYHVALRLPLYTGGKLEQDVVIADLDKEISLQRERLGVQELTFDTSSVYLKILHLSKLDQAYAATLASLESQKKRVELLVKVGKAPRLDLLKTDVLLSKARHDRLQVQHRRREAYTLLYNLMGQQGPVAATPLVSYEPAGVPGWNLDQLVQDAEASRPEIKIAERQVLSSAAQVGIARGERLPSVSLVGAYSERSGADQDYFNDWNLGVQLSLPLTDGGIRRSRVEQAVLAEQQALRAAEQVRLDVHKQVQDAWNAQQESVSRLQVTGSSVREAEEALSIEKLKYEQGVGVITDLLGAQSALLTAQADRLQAEFDLISSRLAILRVTGQLTPERVMSLVVAGEAKDNRQQ